MDEQQEQSILGASTEAEILNDYVSRLVRLSKVIKEAETYLVAASKDSRAMASMLGKVNLDLHQVLLEMCITIAERRK
jgi:hypothetical protein